MRKEAVNKEGNPISQAAEQLRGIIKTSVQENLDGIFPKNYQYKCGDYNLIFIIAVGYGNKCNGFYNTAQMVVLTPEGEIKSGEVYQRVENDHSVWEFREANMVKASDLETVRFAPQLMKNLSEKLEDELSEEEDPNKIVKGINYLVNNQNLSKQLFSISYDALREMGEEDPELNYKNTGQPNIEDLAEIIKAIEEQTEYKIARNTSFNFSIEQKKVAIDLFMNKKELMDELRDIAFNMKAPLVEQKIKEIVQTILNNNMFPIDWEDKTEIGWFGIRDIDFKSLSSPIYSKGRHLKRTWGISINGQVREFEKKSPNDCDAYFCAEHLLEQGPEIVERLIDKSIKIVFREVRIR